MDLELAAPCGRAQTSRQMGAERCAGFPRGEWLYLGAARCVEGQHLVLLALPSSCRLIPARAHDAGGS